MYVFAHNVRQACNSKYIMHTSIGEKRILVLKSGCICVHTCSVKFEVSHKSIVIVDFLMLVAFK